MRSLLMPCLESQDFRFPLLLDDPPTEIVIADIEWDVLLREDYGEIEILYINPKWAPEPPVETWQVHLFRETAPEQELSIALDLAGGYLTLTYHVEPGGYKRPEARLQQYHPDTRENTLIRATPTDWFFQSQQSLEPQNSGFYWRRVNLLTYKEAALAVA